MGAREAERMDSGGPARVPALAAQEPRPRSPILVVDDDDALRESLQAGLEDLGYRADVARSVSEARARLSRAEYSLVLSDYDMPGGSGLDLLGYVRDVYPHLPFIMITGHVNAELACRAISAGALDFLPKPFEFPELVRIIDQNHARLRRDRRAIADLEEGLLAETIGALVAAVDAKDPHTAYHSERVCRLASRLGEAVGLSAEWLRALRFAALLHDVGKIAVPDEILRKPGPLTPEEWSLVREHPARSAHIVAQVSGLRETATIIRHHHERADGDGYPDRLCGEAIPFLTRILTLADVYEALTSSRAYRPPFSPEVAQDIIRDGLGEQFDAELGRLFLSLTDLP
jgi:response regulator RpfG family c-di-GMP phosphodiesterase